MKLLFFLNDTATTEIYTLSLHDALPISSAAPASVRRSRRSCESPGCGRDRKSTRLNSSHTVISYAVFCLKKKNVRGAASPRSATCLHQRCDRRRVHLRADDRWVPAASTADACPRLFVFNDTATTEIYPLSLHDALPI